MFSSGFIKISIVLVSLVLRLLYCVLWPWLISVILVNSGRGRGGLPRDAAVGMEPGEWENGGTFYNTRKDFNNGNYGWVPMLSIVSFPVFFHWGSTYRMLPSQHKYGSDKETSSPFTKNLNPSLGQGASGCSSPRLLHQSPSIVLSTAHTRCEKKKT